MIEMKRFAVSPFVCTANSSAATTSGRFAMSGYPGGCVLIAATGGATQVSWYGAHSQNGTPVLMRASGAAVTDAVTDSGIQIPDVCYGLPFVVPVVAGATTMAMTVCLKG